MWDSSRWQNLEGGKNIILSWGTWPPAPVVAPPLPPPLKKSCACTLWDNCVLCVIRFNKTCIKKYMDIYLCFHSLNRHPPPLVKMYKYYLMGITECSNFKHKWIIEEVPTEGMQGDNEVNIYLLIEKKGGLPLAPSGPNDVTNGGPGSPCPPPPDSRTLVTALHSTL